MNGLDILEQRKVASMVIHVDFAVPFQPLQNERVMAAVSELHRLLPTIKLKIEQFSGKVKKMFKNEEDAEARSAHLSNIFHALETLYNCSLGAQNGYGECPMCRETGGSDFMDKHIADHVGLFKFIMNIE